MERQETKLFEAAAQGCISSLQKLLKDDPLILDRVIVNSFHETPLHVAAMLGHVDFVIEILRIRPQLTNELNSQLSSPLHLASAKGHVDVVRALLSVDSRTCLARDRNRLTPLHLAAVKGRVKVMKMLLQAQPDGAQLTVYRGENILHLCVKNYQLEALKLLVKTIGDPEFINSKDTDGNTVLHLAVADKQVETIDFLLSVPTLEVNALNNDGMTAVDVLIRNRRDVRELLIKDFLKHAGGFGLETNIQPDMNQNMAIQVLSPHHEDPTSGTSTKNNRWERLFKQHGDWLDKQKNALMVVASVIATMAFQVGVNPPSGVWQDDNSPANPPAPDDHQPGSSIMAHNYPDTYAIFYILNTTGFVASLIIILLLMSGLPIRRRFFMWILMVITWIAITAMALTYVVSIAVLTPNPEEKSIFKLIVVLNLVVVGWPCLMALLLIGHIIRLLVKLIKKLRKTLRNRGTAAAGSAVLGNNVANNAAP